MIIFVDKESLYNSFRVSSFSDLVSTIDTMAPSLVEYYLSDLCQYCDNVYFNKRNINNSISIGDYVLYKDYEDDIYIEINKTEEETQSLW